MKNSLQHSQLGKPCAKKSCGQNQWTDTQDRGRFAGDLLWRNIGILEAAQTGVVSLHRWARTLALA